jgi:hypothetical protein
VANNPEPVVWGVMTADYEWTQQVTVSADE